MQGNSLNLHTPLISWVGLKDQDIESVQLLVYFFFIKLSTKTYLTCVCYDLNDTEGELRGFIFCDLHVSLK